MFQSNIKIQKEKLISNKTIQLSYIRMVEIGFILLEAITFITFLSKPSKIMPLFKTKGCICFKQLDKMFGHAGKNVF